MTSPTPSQGVVALRRRRLALSMTRFLGIATAALTLGLSLSGHTVLGLCAAISLAGCVAALVAIRRGYVRAAGVLTTLSGWFALSAGVALAGGVHAEYRLWLTVVPLVGGLVGGIRTGVLGGALAIGTIAALYVADQYLGGLPVLYSLRGGSLSSLVVTSVILIEVAALTVIFRWRVEQSDAAFLSAVAQLEEQRVVAEAASRAKDALLTNMSHELRTPLNGVIGMTELLLRTDLAETQRESLDVVRSSAAGLLSVLNDVLDLARLQSGEVELHPVSFEPRRLALDVLRNHAPTALATGTRLVVDASPSVPRVLRADASRLRQVLGNLVGNAVKFTDAGVVTIALDWHDGRLQVRVVDTGIGIPEDKQEVIFEDFGQAAPTTQRLYGGTGLGLPISRRLVHALGGELSVRSAVGEGACFSFTLPVVAASSGPKACDLSGRRIALVGEFRPTLDSFVAALQAAGADVQIVERVGDLESETPHVIVLEPPVDDKDNDLGLACAYVGANQVILLACIGDVGIVRQGQRVGIRRVLSLPTDGETVVDAVLALHAPERVQRPVPNYTPIAEQPRTVLLVEDNPVNQRVAELMLKQAGHRVRIASTGAEAIDIASDELIDLVLMDVQMPGMDGFEATRALRGLKGGARLPIVGLTALTGNGVSDRATAAGMNGIVTKPFTHDTLLAAVEQWAQPIPRAPEAAAADLDEVHLAFLVMAGASTGQDDAITQLVGSYREKSAQWIEAIRSVHHREPAAAGQLAHSLVGVAGAVGATRVAALAREVMLLAEKGAVPASTVESLASAVRVADAELHRWMAEHAQAARQVHH